jgi:PilZ domain
VDKVTGSGLRAVLEVDDRRQHQRVEPEGGTVEAQIAGKTVIFAIDNLSEGGALIAGRLEVDQGASCELRIALPGIAPIVLTARIVRHVTRLPVDYTAVMFLTSSDLLAHWISEIVLQGLRAAFPEL